MEFHLAQVHEAVERAVPDRECIVFRDRRLTYTDVGDRSRRLANVLVDQGLGKVVDRAGLAGHESGQDHLAIYLHNGNEYLESMLGAYKARLAPFNVNYRYVAEELEYLLTDSGARAIVYHSAFAPTLAQVRDRLPLLQVLLQVSDDSGNDLLPGAQWYEEALEQASPELPEGLAESWSPDDLYILYTGGTTGMPKGVLWRQSDIFVGALGGRRLDTGEEWTSLEEIVANAPNGGTRALPGPPFMHGAAHWMAFNSFTNTNTLVVASVPEHLDPVDVLGLVERESVNVLLIVGDAFGRPIVEEIERGDYALSSLLITVSGGAALSPGIKERFLAAVPTMLVVDGLGASETGTQASQLTSAGQTAETGTFTPAVGMCILSEDLDRVLTAGHSEMGWLAQQGRVPLGYLGDAAKTARTFPEIDGVRYSVPGDRARVTADGTLELYGRDSATINSGGEKIFAEEVEQALLRHPSVADCLVAGRVSERWGNEVVAMVQLSDGVDASDDDILEEAARHIARYKLPKEIVRVERIQRSPSGKADYRWAKEPRQPPVAEELVFRTATTDDVDAVVALVSAAYRGEASTVGWTSEDHLLKGQRADAAMVDAAITDPDGTVVLVDGEGDDEGALLGCIQITHAGTAAHFGMFAVDPTLQARGVGSALLAHAEDLARRTWGCTSMDLEVIAQREQLIAYYLRRGYEPTGETTPFPYGDERFGIPQRDDLRFVVLRRDL